MQSLASLPAVGGFCLPDGVPHAVEMPAIHAINAERGVEFADGLIVAHPDLSLIEIASSWCTPDQGRALVSALQHVKTHQYSGEDREILVLVADVTVESVCSAGLIWVDDEPHTQREVEYLEVEIIRAVRHAEGL